jgi:hypothetical protein
MQASYVCSEQHYGLMLGFNSFISLKLLSDSGCKLEPYYYKVDHYSSNYSLVEYVFKTIWGEENMQIDEMEIDRYQMVLYRIKVKEFKNLDIDILKKIEKEAEKTIKVIEYNSMWGDKLFEAWYANSDGFEILLYDEVNIDINFTKQTLAFVNKIQELL